MAIKNMEKLKRVIAAGNIDFEDGDQDASITNSCLKEMLDLIDALEKTNDSLRNKILPGRYRIGYMRGLADGYSDLSERINKMEGMDL